MKAPDKIYLGIGPMCGDEIDERYLYAEWYEEPKDFVENIEYIRKDLIEHIIRGALGPKDALNKINSITNERAGTQP